jgi:hypothetical protein
MTTRRQFLGSIPAAGAAFAVGSGPAALTASTFARAEETAAPGPNWRSPSLVEETVTGPNRAITSRDISEVNDRLAKKRAVEVAPLGARPLLVGANLTSCKSPCFGEA